tara:strand:- start:303 stop:458 length:156 start_codon:yes stop_codon:yes gene_type:complete
MPQKDKEQNGRERKKSKKGRDQNGIYSSKHIRLIENRLIENRITNDKKNKK